MYKVNIRMNGLRASALITFAVVLAAGMAGAGHGVGESVLIIPADDIKRLIENGERVMFVDLRSEQEFRQGRLPGARSLPLADLSRRYGEIPRAGRVVLYCACPADDVEAAFAFLRDHGFRNVTVLDEGLVGWTRRGYRLEQ